MAENPILVLIQGDTPGQRWELHTTRVITIGRSARNTIQLMNPTVSRFHCEIAYSNGLWYLTDLNSRKGTYLNGQALEEREVLKSGDVIRITSNLLRFTNAKELDEIEADPDELGEDGIDLMEGRFAKEALKIESKARIKEKIYSYLKESKYWAKSVAVPIFAIILSFIISNSILGFADSRVGQRREEIRRNRMEAANDLQGVKQEIKMFKDNASEYARILENLAQIIEKHKAYPEAVKALELYFTVENSYFQYSMESVNNDILEEDYSSARDKIVKTASLIRNDDLKARIRAEMRNLSEIAGPELDPPHTEPEEAIKDTVEDDIPARMPDEEELLDRLERPPLF